ncbi:hypothetical protein FS749_011729 [Ceratobasidium sp. UAMH 11750]|nr:hypothetical protein FS749_011729 [Ceratobasidium sp. UAMH 11750]
MPLPDERPRQDFQSLRARFEDKARRESLKAQPRRQSSQGVLSPAKVRSRSSNTDLKKVSPTRESIVPETIPAGEAATKPIPSTPPVAIPPIATPPAATIPPLVQDPEASSADPAPQPSPNVNADSEPTPAQEPESEPAKDTPAPATAPVRKPTLPATRAPNDVVLDKEPTEPGAQGTVTPVEAEDIIPASGEETAGAVVSEPEAVVVVDGAVLPEDGATAEVGANEKEGGVSTGPGSEVAEVVPSEDVPEVVIQSEAASEVVEGEGETIEPEADIENAGDEVLGTPIEDLAQDDIVGGVPVHSDAVETEAKPDVEIQVQDKIGPVVNVHEPAEVEVAHKETSAGSEAPGEIPDEL